MVLIAHEKPLIAFKDLVVSGKELDTLTEDEELKKLVVELQPFASSNEVDPRELQKLDAAGQKASQHVLAINPRGAAPPLSSRETRQLREAGESEPVESDVDVDSDDDEAADSLPASNRLEVELASAWVEAVMSDPARPVFAKVLREVRAAALEAYSASHFDPSPVEFWRLVISWPGCLRQPVFVDSPYEDRRYLLAEIELVRPLRAGTTVLFASEDGREVPVVPPNPDSILLYHSNTPRCSTASESTETSARITLMLVLSRHGDPNAAEDASE